jgi:hypothetical protein
MRIRELRPDSGRGGYARPGSVGALTTVWVGRSVSAASVLKPAVVKKMSLEGKQ